jgi:hypothetical protein
MHNGYLRCMMSDRGPSIYRESALKQYIQGRDKDVLPRLISPPALLLLWLLLSLLLVSGLLSWSLRVPVYTVGRGVIVAGNTQGQTSVVLFFPASQLSVLHPGQSVQLTANATGLNEQQRVVSVEQDLLSPAAASQRYDLSGELSLLVQQPSAAVIVNLNPPLPLSLYEGTIVQAQIQVGSQSLLDLLPLIGNGMGE